MDPEDLRDVIASFQSRCSAAIRRYDGFVAKFIQPRVDAATSARLKDRVVAGAALARDGVVAFRGVDAQRILKEEFAIECSLSSTYRLLHRMPLSWLAPRPRHPQADATAQAAFPPLLNCH